MVVTSSTHGYCLITHRRANIQIVARRIVIISQLRPDVEPQTVHHHPHITSQNLSPPNLQNTPKHNLSLSNPNLINYRTLSNTASPSYHITKSLTTQPTKHTTKSPTSYLPPQTHNTHQNISPHSHNTTQSTTTLLATYHHPISPKKSLITQPAKLIDIQLYQKQQHTHHTNKLTPHLQANHLPAHHNITHLTPATPNSQHKHQEHQLLIHKHTTKSTNTLLPTYHHTQTHISKISNYPTHRTYFT